MCYQICEIYVYLCEDVNKSGEQKKKKKWKNEICKVTNLSIKKGRIKHFKEH